MRLCRRRDPFVSKVGVTSRTWAAIATIAIAGCGGSTPTSPDPPAPIPTIPVSVTVSPNPLKATVLSTDGGASTFKIACDVTLTASVGGARIDQITPTIAFTQQVGQLGNFSMFISMSRNVSIDLPALGTTSFAHSQEFGVGSGDIVSFRMEVRGVDNQGRIFTASSANIPIQFEVR